VARAVELAETLAAHASFAAACAADAPALAPPLLARVSALLRRRALVLPTLRFLAPSRPHLVPIRRASPPRAAPPHRHRLWAQVPEERAAAFDALAARVAEERGARAREEALLADAPDEFLDPIMQVASLNPPCKATESDPRLEARAPVAPALTRAAGRGAADADVGPGAFAVLRRDTGPAGDREAPHDRPL
jgi:hypothetical protein